MFYVYRYIDPVRNVAIYVGKGKNGRMFDHLKRKDIHPLVRKLQKMKSLGIEPLIDKIIDGVDEELALLVEMEAISKYGRKDLGTGTLLNLTNGGEGTSGYVYTESHRQKISDGRKGKTFTEKTKRAIAESNRVAHLGKKLSDIHKQKISESKIGKSIVLPPVTSETKAKLSMAVTQAWAKRKAQAKFKLGEE